VSEMWKPLSQLKLNMNLYQLTLSLLTDYTSASPCPFTQSKVLQPTNLEFEYDWCEGGLKTQELSAKANINGSLGFLWLLTLRPHQWSSILFQGSIPHDLEKQIENTWGSKISFSTDNPNASIDFVACLPSETLEFKGTDIPQVIFLLTKGRRIICRSTVSVKLLASSNPEVRTQARLQPRLNCAPHN